MEEFKLVVVEKYEVENQDALIRKKYGILGRPRMGSKEKTIEGSVLGWQLELPRNKKIFAISFQEKIRCFMNFT